MMIRITKDGATLTFTRGEQSFTLPASEAPQLIAAVLNLLGVSGTAYQRGYQLGVQDGLIEGYARRDREYIVSRLKAQRAAEQAALRSLPSSEVQTA